MNLDNSSHPQSQPQARPTQTQTLALLETILIFVGMGVLFLAVPHRLTSDGLIRFKAVTELLVEGKVSDMGLSMVGPLFCVPLWFLGRIYPSPEWWCARYNFLVFAFGLFAIYRIFKGHMPGGVLRKFALILIFGSMFPHHQADFFGEMFTAILVGVGIAAVTCLRSRWGWVCMVLGAANIPASMVGLGCVVLVKSAQARRWGYLLVPVAAAVLVLGESWIRRGDPFVTGYEGDRGFKTVMPYSGRPGFSYPFFFGVISILFSFGKGLFLFAPGLLLSIGRRMSATKKEVHTTYRLWIWFLVGMVLVYSRWYAWYGGWYWGPRFFLFASIPASFALAVRLSAARESFASNLLTLGVLVLSFWVGVNGAVFDQNNLELCTANKYELEFLCWYVPEFSVLFRPFVEASPLAPREVSILLYGLVVCAYLAIPLLSALLKAATTKAAQLRRALVTRGGWRF